jgi:hypothetical protein
LELQKKGNDYYQDIAVSINLESNGPEFPNKFYLNYDVIVHQVVNHNILVSIRQDWANGIHPEKPVELGVISMDIVNNTLPVFIVKRNAGSNWQGFKTFVSLGIKHIAAGTDHLLFLLVLLVPLLVNQNKWGSNRPVRHSLIHIIKVVTAFTIGHSITLIFGVSEWIVVPSKPIEVLIGVSILVSSIHAIKPIFPNKETYIAMGFGLIHGLAFAYTLQDLHLSTYKMALSILGFNLGIELMQLAVIIAVIPWLLLLSRTSFYMIFRISGAILAIIAAIAWIIERLFEESNVVTDLITKVANYSFWFLGILIFGAVFGYFLENNKKYVRID